MAEVVNRGGFVKVSNRFNMQKSTFGMSKPRNQKAS